MSGKGGTATEHRLPPRSRLRSAFPLLLAALAVLAIGVYLSLANVTVGGGRLPVWLLFVGMGAISAAAAGVTLIARPPSFRPTGVRPFSSMASPLGSREGRRAGPVRPEAPEPPRPKPQIGTPTPLLSSPSQDEAPPGSRMEPAAPLTAPEASPVSASSLVPPVQGEVVPAATERPPRPEPETGVAGTVECATCGRHLPAREAWRRCRSCGRVLCVTCLTESVRTYGSGYCRNCSGASS